MSHLESPFGFLDWTEYTQKMLQDNANEAEVLQRELNQLFATINTLKKRLSAPEKMKDLQSTLLELDAEIKEVQETIDRTWAGPRSRACDSLIEKREVLENKRERIYVELQDLSNSEAKRSSTQVQPEDVLLGNTSGSAVATQ